MEVPFINGGQLRAARALHAAQWETILRAVEEEYEAQATEAGKLHGWWLRQKIEREARRRFKNLVIEKAPNEGLY